jgi:hypothetical protein
LPDKKSYDKIVFAITQTKKILKKIIGALAITTILATPFLNNNLQVAKVNAAVPIPVELSVAITNIKIIGTQYSVDFTPSGYTPTQGETHTHFYYNTEENIIMNKMFSGPSPYSLDTTTKPAGATQLCAIVSEANHAVIANSGNCFDLPSPDPTNTSSSSSSQLSAVASVGTPTLGGYFGSPITGFLGGVLPNIPTTQSGLASGTVAYFTSGYNFPVVGTIQGQVFIPNQGQIIPLTATIGNATGTLSVNIAGQPSLKLTIPTNFSPAPVTTGGSITINTTGNNQNSSYNSSVVDYNYCLDQSDKKHVIQTKSADIQRSINIKGVGGGVGISNSNDSTNISCSDLGNLCLDISSEQYAIKTKHDTVKNSVGNIRREIANSSSNTTVKDFSIDLCEQFVNELPANLPTTPALKNAIKTKGVGKNIEPVVSNTELVQFEDGTHLTIARKGWDGSVKGITAGDQLLIEEPCQGSFGQVALTFKKGINEGGLKLTEIDQNNLFPNLVGDLSNGCNMSITGFDKDDVSEARVYLGSNFGERINAGLQQQAGGALANGVDSPTSNTRKFFRVVQNGRLINSETGEFLQAQYSNSPWKTADIAVDNNGQYYVSIPSSFKQFAISKGVLNNSIEKISNISLTRTGGFSDSSFGTRLVLFLLIASFITMKTYEKN